MALHLVKRKASITTLDSQNRNILHYCCMFDNYDLASFFLKSFTNEIDINKIDDCKMTALDYSTQNQKMVELLKGFGAKENTSETSLNLSNAMKLEKIKNIKADMHKTFKVLEYTNYSADSDVKHSDFSLHQMIGKGSFGEVY